MWKKLIDRLKSNKRLFVFEGDKTVLIILALLYMLSIITVFSATSKLFGSLDKRVTGMLVHVGVMSACALLTFLIYRLASIPSLKRLARLGFVFSLIPLLILNLNINLGSFLSVGHDHDAVRYISVMGVQIHVAEVVKVMMVLYMSWAVDALKENKVRYLPRLAKRWKKPWLDTPFARESFYIYLPFLTIILMVVLTVGNSSTALVGLTMLLTILVAGFSIKKVAVGLAIAAVGFGGVLLLKPAGSGRSGTFTSRIRDFLTPYEQRIGDFRLQIEAAPDAAERRRLQLDMEDYIQHSMQVQGAKIAIHEGGLIGKLPGGSTQKYKVPHIFGDFMYSFICEEYGLFGALLVLVLYGFLLARGAVIANACKTVFTRGAVGGLSLLISLQALLHILVNTGLFPMTGQTLPLLSNGKGAFVMFSIAFAVILSISKLVRREVDRADRQTSAQALFEASPAEDNVADTLDELDELESGNYEQGE